MATITCVGESLIDIIRPADDTAPIEHVGGSPANVALALGRLGHDVHLLTWIGPDARGSRIAQHLADSGVTLLAGSHNAARTSTAAAQLGADGAAQYTFDIEWDLPSPVPTLPAGNDCLHIGSIGAVLEPGGSKVLALCEQQRLGQLISFDPNIRPALMGSPEAVRARTETLVSLSDVVKLSDEDAAWLYPDLTPEQVAESWLGRGPALVAVTLGGLGALAATVEGLVRIEAPQVAVADTVGAGDTFSAGLMDALARRGQLRLDARPALHALHREDAEQVLTHAAQLAAVTVTRPGANPPWESELG